MELEKPAFPEKNPEMVEKARAILHQLHNEDRQDIQESINSINEQLLSHKGKSLFTHNSLKKFASDMAKSICDQAFNSSLSILILYDVLKYNFYKVELLEVTGKIEDGLNKNDEQFLLSFAPMVSNEFFKNIAKAEFLTLYARFFDYYFSRIPTLRFSTVTHRYKKRKLTAKDISYITTMCYLEWMSRSKNLYKNYNFTGEYRAFTKKFWFRKDLLNDKVYDAGWIEPFLENNFSQLSVNKNIWWYLIHIIESSFPMYWDTFQAQFRSSLFWYANFGCFSGDKNRFF